LWHIIHVLCHHGVKQLSGRAAETDARQLCVYEEMGSIVAKDSGVRVLVVDDDRSIRETLHAVLQEEGYHVLEAEDGKAALDILRASAEPLVVLLDLRMPVLDGAGLLSIVAEDRHLATFHSFLLITANLDQITGKTARLLHQLHVPVIPKPFELDALIESVMQAAYRKMSSAPDAWSDTSPHQAARGTNQ
jgi:CheY-like chemotaxis protein